MPPYGQESSYYVQTMNDTRISLPVKDTRGKLIAMGPGGGLLGGTFSIFCNFLFFFSSCAGIRALSPHKLAKKTRKGAKQYMRIPFLFSSVDVWLYLQIHTTPLPSHVVAKCGKKSKTSPVFPNGKRSLTGGGGKTIGSTQKERKRALELEGGGGRRWAGLIGALSATVLEHVLERTDVGKGRFPASGSEEKRREKIANLGQIHH